MITLFKSLFLIFCCVLNLEAQSQWRKNKLKFCCIRGFSIFYMQQSKKIENSNKDLNSYMRLDTCFLSIDALQKGFGLSFQYRSYPVSKTNFIHHA